MTDKKNPAGNGKDKESKAAATREEAAQNAKALSAAERRLSEIRSARREEKMAGDAYESDRVKTQKSKKVWEESVAHLGAVIDNDQLNLFPGPLSKAAAKGVVGQVVTEAKKQGATGATLTEKVDATLAAVGAKFVAEDAAKPGEKKDAPVAGGKKKARARQKLLTHHTGKGGIAQPTA